MEWNISELKPDTKDYYGNFHAQHWFFSKEDILNILSYLKQDFINKTVEDALSWKKEQDDKKAVMDAEKKKQQEIEEEFK
jgi:hypothetical protein